MQSRERLREHVGENPRAAIIPLFRDKKSSESVDVDALTESPSYDLARLCNAR